MAEIVKTFLFQFVQLEKPGCFAVGFIFEVFCLFSPPLLLKCYMCTEAAKQALGRIRPPYTLTLLGISVLN